MKNIILTLTLFTIASINLQAQKTDTIICPACVKALTESETYQWKYKDTIVCPECINERIVDDPSRWRYSFSNTYENQNDFVVYADSTHKTKLSECKHYQNKTYYCSYYLNGQKGEVKRLEDEYPCLYDYNGDTIVSYVYNYKGERIISYWANQTFLHRHFFQDSIDFKYEQQREDGEKKYPDDYLIINLDNEMESYPHHTGYWMRRHITEAPLDASNKLDSLAYYKNIKTILIDISDFDQDKLLKSKLKALKSMPNLKQISLKGSGFKKIPDEIYLCKNLEVLEMIDTKIKTISPDIINLKKLRSFVLMNTKDFDYENAINYLSQLPNLNSILLQYNLNSPLPRALANCKKLIVLDLGSEQFQVKGPEYKGFTQTQQENLVFLGSLTQIKCLAAPYTSDEQFDYLIKLILDKKLNGITLYDTIYESDWWGAFRER